MLDIVILKSLTAGLLASLACGLGALPLAIRGIDAKRLTGTGYGFAGGLMVAASVYNLIFPGLTMNGGITSMSNVLQVIVGIGAGGLFISSAGFYLSPERLEQHRWARWGTRKELLIFLAMFIHSIPEGVAVGVGYASGELYANNLGKYIALAIAIHNIPEGLAVSIPLRSGGATIKKCFLAALITSLPQPIASVPAAAAAWFFTPIMPILMGFAAGAMIFLVLLEMLPDAFAARQPRVVAWSFLTGFCLMLLVQVVL